LKLCTRDVGEVTHHANFGFNRYSGTSPEIGEILTWLFWLSCPYLFLDPAPRSHRWTDFHARFMAQTLCFRARMVLLGVSTMGDHIWRNMPPNSPLQKLPWI